MTRYLARAANLRTAVALVAVSIALVSAEPLPSHAGAVSLVRVPDQGIQPQVAVDAEGGVHLVYFRGEAGNGDLIYTRLAGDGRPSGATIRVNREPGSAIATGTVRGARLAIGRNRRVHVTWNGSSRATPRGPQGATPMLYSRLNAARTAFEPQRNLIESAVGLDGGGAIAADTTGRVYVAWHAGGPDSKSEDDRRVWLSRSPDDGRTFSREEPVSDPTTGACGCCGMAALVDRQNALQILYRSARDMVHRDTYLLTVRALPSKPSSTRLQEWNIGACPMSMFALAQSGPDILAAWETAGQVQFARVARTGEVSAPIEVPGAARTRRHPAIAVNARGDVVLAWTEGTGWQRGGSVAWQVFDKNGRATADFGRADGVVVWNLAAAYARPDGTFAIVY